MALTVGFFSGFENYELIEWPIRVGAGLTSKARSGQYAALFDTSSDLLARTVAAVSSPDYIAAGFCFTNLSHTSEIVLWRAEDFDQTNTNCTLNLNASNQFVFRNASGTALWTSNAISVDQYYFVEVWKDSGNSSGAWQVWINGVSQSSGTGQDFETGSYNGARVEFCGNDSSVFALDDVVLATDDGSTPNNLGDVRVVAYQSNKDSSTPDATPLPVNAVLDEGEWDNAYYTGDTLYASYDSDGYMGGVFCDDIGGNFPCYDQHRDVSTLTSNALTHSYFKPDGTKFYFQGADEGIVYQVNLSSAWDLSTATYSGSKDIDSLVSQTNGAQGIAFSSDGTKLFISYYVSSTEYGIYQLDLSTAWDITTASYTSGNYKNFYSAGWNIPFSIYFLSDGETLYAVDNSFYELSKYSLSTAWDESTLSLVDDGFLPVNGITNFEAPNLHVNEDELDCYLGVCKFDFGTAGDVDTLSILGNGQDTGLCSPRGSGKSPRITPDENYLISNVGGTTYLTKSKMVATGVINQRGGPEYDSWIQEDSQIIAAIACFRARERLGQPRTQYHYWGNESYYESVNRSITTTWGNYWSRFDPSNNAFPKADENVFWGFGVENAGNRPHDVSQAYITILYYPPVCTDLQTEVGSYSVTGEPVAFKRALKLKAVTGSYSYTGVDPDLSTAQQYTLEAAQGSYATTGVEAALKRALRLKADSGSYSTSGLEALFQRGLRFKTDTGSYSVTGDPASFKRHYTLGTELGEYTITGQPVAFKRQYRMLLDTGSYTVTGVDPDLAYVQENILLTNVGSYSVAGIDAALKRSLRLKADSGEYSYLGVSADFKKAKQFDLETGQYLLTGNSASLKRHVQLHADAGSYTITGIAAELQYLPSNTLATETGSYQISGLPAALKAGRRLKADAGSYSVSGLPAELDHFREFPAETGSYQITGQDAGLRRNLIIRVETGSYSVTGVDPDIRMIGDLTLEAAKGSYKLTGISAGLRRGYTLDANTGIYTISGQPSTFRRDLILELNTGSYKTTGLQPRIKAKRKVLAQTGSYLLTGFDVEFETARTILAHTGSYQITGASAKFIDQKMLKAETGAYTIVPFNPDLQIDGHLGADTGHYLTSGFNARLKATRLWRNETGTYLISGQPVTFSRGYRMGAQRGRYFLTGFNAELDKAYQFRLETGLYSITGLAVDFTPNYELKAQTGSYVLTGYNPDLQTEGTMKLDLGHYQITGEPSALKRSLILRVDQGTYTVSGQEAFFFRNQSAPAETGVYQITGIEPDFAVNRKLRANTGQYSVTGYNPDLQTVGNLQADTGFYSVTGFDARLKRKMYLRTALGSYSITGIAADLSATEKFGVQTGSYQVTGQPVKFKLQKARNRYIVIS